MYARRTKHFNCNYLQRVLVFVLSSQELRPEDETGTNPEETTTRNKTV